MAVRDGSRVLRRRGFAVYAVDGPNRGQLAGIRLTDLP